jgi:hypothetical protein
MRLMFGENRSTIKKDMHLLSHSSEKPDLEEDAGRTTQIHTQSLTQ